MLHTEPEEIEQQIKRNKLTMADMPQFIAEQVTEAYEQGLCDDVETEEEERNIKYAIEIIEEIKLREMFLHEKLAELHSELCRFMK